jgi:hypothetical protein
MAPNGAEASDRSEDAAISADGRFVTFASAAANLVPGDTNGRDDIFVRDTCHGAPPGCVPSTTRVSVATDGTQGDLDSSDPSISGTGRFVAFASFASTLVVGDSNLREDVFLRDTCLGAPAPCVPSTTRLSVASNGAQVATRSDVPSISGDGTAVAFFANVLPFLPQDTNDEADIYLVDTPFAPGLTLEVTTAGQTLRVRARLTPVAVGPVDAYVVFVIQNVGLFSLQLDGSIVPGLVPIVAGLVPGLPFEAEVFSFPLSPSLPAGTHAILSGLTLAGTLTLVGTIDENVFTLPAES